MLTLIDEVKLSPLEMLKQHVISSVLGNHLLVSVKAHICVQQGKVLCTFCSAFYELCESLSKPAHNHQQKRTGRLL